MSLATAPSFYRRLGFRLTAWYVGVLVVALLAGLGVLFHVMGRAIVHQADLELAEVAERSATAMQSGGLDAVLAEASDEVEFSGRNDSFYRVFRGGKLAGASDLMNWGDVTMPPSVLTPRGAPSYEDWSGAGVHSEVRVLTARLGPDVVLQVGTNVADYLHIMRHAREDVSLILLALVLTAALVGWVIAHRALAGVRRLTAAAGEVSHGHWDSRAAVTGRGDDIDQLTVTFNDMLDRLAAVLRSMKETNDNIAHELRSPLTCMRGEAETAMMRSPLDEPAREIASTTVEECDRLLGIINSMLDIAEAEAKAVSWPMAAMDLSQVASDACELFEPVGEDKAVALQCGSEGDCRMRGNMQQMQRAVANLVDNAVKYSPRGARVDVRVVRRGEVVQLTVRNEGAGISETDLPRVFERFYRCEGSRSGPGSGLGLSLAQAIVRAHGGTLAAASRLGEFTEFTLQVPAETSESTATR